MPSFAVPESRITGNLGEDLQYFTVGDEELEEQEEYSNGSGDTIRHAEGLSKDANVEHGSHEGTLSRAVSLLAYSLFWLKH